MARLGYPLDPDDAPSRAEFAREVAEEREARGVCPACGGRGVIGGPDRFGNYDPCPACEDEMDPDETHSDFAWPTAEEAVAEAERARPAGERPARASFDERQARHALYGARSGAVTASPIDPPIKKTPRAVEGAGVVTNSR